MPKRTSDAEPVAVRVTVITLDGHIAGAVERARRTLGKRMPGLSLSLHVASDWAAEPEALERCRRDIAQADIILVTMLFMEDHAQPVLADLKARRDNCDALVALMSAGEIMRLTRMGRFTMDGSGGGAISLLKKLRGQRRRGSSGGNSGARQMAMIRRIPRLLRFIPGAAQDVRAYFLCMQYFLASSEENIANLVRFLVGRYAAGPRAPLQGTDKVPEPVEYPETGVYHPRLQGGVGVDAAALPRPTGERRGTVGLLLMRSYVLAADSDHYDAVIEAFESRGYAVVPAFASGLDGRAAVERYFMHEGRASVDAVVSLTGFSLVGGPAYNDADAAAETLRRLDVPYLAAQALEFQSLEQWRESDRGLMPVEATMMVAIPELDGATGPMVFAGRGGAPGESGRRMEVDAERTAMLAQRVDHLVRLRAKPRAERTLGIVIFGFPPEAGAVGTAAYLAVFESLQATLQQLQAAGYGVEVPATADELRQRIVDGNSGRFGSAANVYDRISVDDHVARETWLDEIESQWGPAPGRQLSDGAALFIQGERFGNVFIGVQPGFGYEGDPMRMLFDRGLAPTHAFSAFYRYLREDLGADAVLHFGTHGALEFMPGKHCGLGAGCWPDRLIGALPNFYLYAANNPSEGTIAKRRSAATLVSYMTPPVVEAGLYRGIQELKESVQRWRSLPPENERENTALAELIQAQAAALDLAEAEPAWTDASTRIDALRGAIRELEYTLIPQGLHVLGRAPERAALLELVRAMASAAYGDDRPGDQVLDALADGVPLADLVARFDLRSPDDERVGQLAAAVAAIRDNRELEALVAALDGRFVAPAPGGDLLRNTAIVPTGRNVHGFDPYRIPSAFAVRDGAEQAERLLAKHTEGGNPPPQSIAMVLWGTDNLKSEGGPIGQALALIGARPRFDSYGRLAGAELIPLEALGRARVDVVITLSGIFRDLLPLQTRALAEAAYLAACADEPADLNPIRRNTLAYQRSHGCDFETAALRVFSNADGAYGSNVGAMIDDGGWGGEDELAETYTRRKCFAYGRNGRPVRQAELLGSMLGGVELAYQNLESVELGVTTVDHYFDTLGGISRAVTRERGGDEVPVYVGDQTQGEGQVRTLADQVALETRTRMLNPKFYEGLLEHGYEGVHQLEVHLTNTLGWSATTGQVAPWVYQRLSETFVLDEAMRERLATLNPAACAKLANRLLEAHEREYWAPDPEVLESLRRAGDELEDRLEGVVGGVAA